MRALRVLIFVLWGFINAWPALANFCAQDAVPAATLLFPYVEVAMTPAGTPDDAGQTAISQITNVGREAVVVHFTVWDLAGVPRLTFDEVLSGFDSVQINWRDVIRGRFDLFDTSRSDFSATSPMTFDPFEWGPDGRGQRGGLTTPENRSAVAGAECAGLPPYGNRSDLLPTIVSLLRGSEVARSHSGCGFMGLRADQSQFGTILDASRIFFYVTADVTLRCTTLLPSAAEYWAGVAGNANVLVGHLVHLDARANTSEMVTAVHIEASSVVNGGPSVFGFYEEKNGGVETNREPLATAFMVPFANDVEAGIRSSIVVWKNFAELSALDDPEADLWSAISDCGSYLYYAWDMDERSVAWVRSGTEPPLLPSPNQFPFATQKVPLNNAYFDLPAPYGWLLVVLPPSYGSEFVDPTPEEFGYRARPYMGWAAVQLNYGTYSAGAEGITMGNALCFPTQTLPLLGVNDGTTPIR